MKKIINGDSKIELKSIPNDTVSALITDPPYAINFMGREWDKALPDKEIWRECFRVMKSGAYGFVFSVSRMDLLAKIGKDLSDAGFDISFSPLFWTYSQGFPKLSEMSKKIMKRIGDKGKVVSKQKLSGSSRYLKGQAKRKDWYHQGEGGQYTEEIEIKEPTTEEGKNFQGFYGARSLKPAVETIIMIQKPPKYKTQIDQALESLRNKKIDDGCINIDECRIPFKLKDFPKKDTKGRHPATLIVSDSALGDYSKYFDIDLWFEKHIRKLPDEVIEKLPFLEVSKMTKKQRNEFKKINKKIGKDTYHPTVKPVKLMTYLITLVTRENEIVLDAFAGYGSTLVACELINRNYIGIEINKDYFSFMKERIKYINK